MLQHPLEEEELVRDVYQRPTKQHNPDGDKEHVAACRPPEGPSASILDVAREENAVDPVPPPAAAGAAGPPAPLLHRPHRHHVAHEQEEVRRGELYGLLHAVLRLEPL